MRKIRIASLLLTICLLIAYGFPELISGVINEANAQIQKIKIDKALARGDYQTAIEQLEAISFKQPTNAKIHLKLVDLYKTQHMESRSFLPWKDTPQSKKMIEHLQKAAEIQSKNIELHERLAHAHLNLDEKQQASEAARIAVRLGSQDSKTMRLAFDACIAHSDFWWAELILKSYNKFRDRDENLSFWLLSSQLATSTADMSQLNQIIDDALEIAERYFDDDWKKMNQQDLNDAIAFLEIAATQRAHSDNAYTRAPKTLKVLDQFSNSINHTGMEARSYLIAISLFNALYSHGSERWQEEKNIQKAHENILKKCQALIFENQDFHKDSSQIDFATSTPEIDHQSQVHLLEIELQEHLKLIQEPHRIKDFTSQNSLRQLDIRKEHSSLFHTLLLQNDLTRLVNNLCETVQFIQQELRSQIHQSVSITISKNL